jgi:hypothetical protein
MYRRKQAPVIAVVSGWNDREMNVAALQAVRDAGAAVLDQLDIDGRVPAPKGRQEIGEHGLHMLGAAADPQRPGFAGPERACALAERIGVLQQAPAAP